MRKDVALLLKNKSSEVALKFSKTDRTNNFNNESFKVVEIKPISAMSAYVIYEKNTGKRALAHFIFIDMPKNPYWTYYFLRTDHLLNLNILVDKYLEVEQHNFPMNFDNDETISSIDGLKEIPDVLKEFPKQV
tara:strand:- start:2834 stop:3232 length:399 start_codon:yes stop_codon:yes gene_type:complete